MNSRRDRRPPDSIVVAKPCTLETRLPWDGSSADGPLSRALCAFKRAMLGLALAAVALAVPNGLLDSLGRSPQFSFTLAGSFAIYLATRPARRELIGTIGLGLALRVAYGATYGVNGYFGSLLISTGGFLGFAGLLTLACTAVRVKRFWEFGIAAYFPFVSILVGFILPVTNHLSPITYDVELLGADSVFGIQPSFLLGSLISGRQTLSDITATIYYALPFTVAFLCAVRMQRWPGEVRRLLWMFGLMSIMGFCLYAVCPGTGPIYAFREWFPSSVPDPLGLAMGRLSVPGAPRNAIPSLHFTTALLVFWNTQRLRRAGRIAAGLFLAATGFAALALGEHYLTDLVVAVPFSLFFCAAFSVMEPADSAWKYAAMSTGAGSVVLWILILRLWAPQLPEHPMATCLAFAATVGVSIWIRAELARRRIPFAWADDQHRRSSRAQFMAE